MAVFYAGDFSAVEKDYIDVSDKLFAYDQNLTPFLALLSKIGRRPMHSVRIDWVDENELVYRTQVNHAAGYSTTDTDIVLDSVSDIYVNAVLLDEDTGELWRVTAINTSTNTVTVTRGFAGTTAAAITDNDNVAVVGVALTEGSSPATYVVNRTANYNFVQEFGLDLETSWLAKGMDSAVRTFNRQDRINATFRHFKTLIERAAIYGQRKDGSTDHIYAMGGILSHIPAGNITSIAVGSMTEDTLEDIIAGSYSATVGSGSRWFFAGSNVIKQVDKILRTNSRSNPDTTVFGLKAKVWQSSFGDVYIVHEPFLSGSIYGNMGFVCDVDYIKLRELYPARILRNIPTSDNKNIDRLYAAVSLEVRGVNTLWKYYGVS